MERTQVGSSNIESIGYDSDSETLEVEFSNGGLYQYFGVPAYVYDELMSASSHGGYLASNVKGIYSYSKV
ncbi:KTSC domain-containing protein [Bermanella sp. R86510]|uniref:KTSC domain-containing protein n=1 Tax=unclassified Bermanella TaxID=2627862 RepID=UPI0037C61EC7